MYTYNKFKSIGLDAFFSGCITLTLPKMEIKKPEREYICAADLPKDILAALKERMKGTGIDIVETTHYKDYRNSNATWEEREAAVKELLTIYQNAKCVVTRRLHCALPCLAMEVPVFVTNRHKRPVSGRFDPYYDWIANCSYKEFLAGKFDYDFADPPANDPAYLEVRNAMIKSIDDFVAKYKDEEGSPEQYKKTSYTAEELYKWRCDTMRDCMNRWFDITVAEEKELKELRAFKKTHENEHDKLMQYKAESERSKKILGCRSVKLAIKARNAFMPKDKKIKV